MAGANVREPLKEAAGLLGEMASGVAAWDLGHNLEAAANLVQLFVLGRVAADFVDELAGEGPWWSDVPPEAQPAQQQGPGGEWTSLCQSLLRSVKGLEACADSGDLLGGRDRLLEIWRWADVARTEAGVVDGMWAQMEGMWKPIEFRSRTKDVPRRPWASPPWGGAADWAEVAAAAISRLSECDPGQEPLTFPGVIAVLDVAVDYALGGEAELAVSVVDLAQLEIGEKMVLLVAAGTGWSADWVFLSRWASQAVEAYRGGRREEGARATLKVGIWAHLVCHRYGVEFGAQEHDRFVATVEALVRRLGRPAVTPAAILEAVGLNDMSEYREGVTAGAVSRAKETASQRREDSLLLRSLASAWGIQSTRGWDSYPWIVVPVAWRDQRLALVGAPDDASDDMEAWAHELADELKGDGSGDSAGGSGGVLGHLPWVRAVLQIPDPWIDERSLRWGLSAPPLWVRYGPMGGADSALFSGRPWLDRARVAGLSRETDWVLFDSIVALGKYEYVEGEPGTRPSVTYDWVFLSFALDRFDPWRSGGMVPLGCGGWKDTSGGPGVSVAEEVPGSWTRQLGEARGEYLFYLGLLAAGDEHPVSVQPRQDRKVAPWKKPWLRKDRPYVILLDPSGRARRRTEPGPSTGQHVRLHQRRGHWRHYRSERYSDERRALRQWIRQSWAGDREWATAGSTYRVMTNPDGSLDTGQGG